MILVLICLFLYITSRFVNGFRLIDGFIIAGFLYFLWREWTQYVWNFENLFALIPILFFIIYAIRDILWGIRVVGLSIPIIQQGVLKYIDIKDILQNWFKDYLYEISELIVILVIFIGFTIQNYWEMPYIELSNHSLMGIFGFEFAIFSLYGIYAAFLQFLTENDKLYYLGISKIRSMLDNSIWSSFTRTLSFHIILLMVVSIPIVIKIQYFDNIKGLTYLWQSCYIFIAIIYLHLLKLNINIAYGIFGLNIEKIKKENNERGDKRRTTEIDGIEKQISIDIQRFFTDEFWKVYNHQENYVGNYISIRLSGRLGLINDSEIGELVSTIFARESFENYNLANRIFEYIEKNKKKDFVKFFKFYKEFCKNKWNTLKNCQESISPSTWTSLIKQDIRVFETLIKADRTLETLKIEYPDKEKEKSMWFYRDEKIREFLFSLLVDKKDIDLDKVLKSVSEEIRNFQEESTNQFFEYTYDFLKSRLVTILDKYENGNVDLNLPKFKKLSDYDVFQNGERNDHENSMIYSQVYFDYLDRGRIQKFSQTIINEEDNDEQKKQKIKSQRIKNIILSMNEEYRLAYMLFQIFYTDRKEWDDNLDFYDTEIRKLMSCDKEHHNYLFKKIKEIIKETNISHRITEQFLDVLWETRNDVIKDFSWFDQFGERHLMSDFKILYVQWLLTGKKGRRFDIEGEFPSERERIVRFCRDYLLLTDQLATIFTKDSHSYNQNNVQVSVEYLLHSGKVNLSDVMDNIPVASLLRLEWILRWRYRHYNQESRYTSRTFFDVITSDSRYYWSGGVGILEFYIVKIIDDFYHDLYQDKEFIDGLKRRLELRLDSLNKTVEEYVDLISEKIGALDNISVRKKGNIISKLNDILFSQDKRIESDYRQRIYRYKLFYNL